IHRQLQSQAQADGGGSKFEPESGEQAAVDSPAAHRFDAFVSAQLGVGWEDGLRAAEPGAALRAGLRLGEGWYGAALDENWLSPAGSELRVRKGHGVLWAGMSRLWGTFEVG